MTTAERVTQANRFEDRLAQIRQAYPVSPQAIDKFCTDPALLSLNHPFEVDYRKSENYEKKFVIAEALIKDGRYVQSHKDPIYLVRNFIPKGREITSEIQAMKDVLELGLIEQGLMPKLDSEDEREAQDAFLRAVQTDETLQNMAGILPLEMMEIVSRVKLWGEIRDEEKLRKIRSFAIRALMRDELGNLLVHVPVCPIDLRNIVLQCPDRVFTDQHYVTSNIVRHFFVKHSLGLFVDGEEEGFNRLEELIANETSPVKRDFFDQIKGDFQGDRNVNVPDVFVDSVEGWYTDRSPMPLFMHKYLVSEFQKNRKKVWNGGTGSTKTTAFYIAAESIGAQKATIFGPAKARNTWPKEAKKIFKEGNQPDVFTVRKFKDLDNPRIETAQYVFVSAEFLSRAWKNSDLHEKVKAALIDRRQTEMVGLDESHEFRNQKTGSSQMLMELITGMRAKYQEGHILEFPIVALTATPISSGLDNLDIPMALLYPERFALPGRHEENKTIFSIQALRDPLIAFSLLYGEKLMEQWDLYNLFGSRVPRPEYERVLVEVTPYQRVIYDWVRDLPVNTFSKMRMLRSVLLNPELIKTNIERRGLTPISPPVNVLAEQLVQLRTQWTEWVTNKDRRIPDEPFSADWIAKFGASDFLLQCFFSKELSSGVNTLAERLPIVRQDWRKAGAASPKYEFLMNFLRDRVQLGENGLVASDFLPTERVFITVPYHRRGITRWIDDSNLRPEELDDNAWSLYEYMRTEWLPGLPQHMSINIDGSSSFVARDRAAVMWRESGDHNIFVVATMDSINESMDWAVRDTPTNKNISVVNAISTGYAFTAEEMEQWGGRYIRPGLGRRVRHLILEAEESFDTNNRDLVRLRSLITQMTLAGVAPSREDLQFYNEATTAKKIILAEPSVGRSFLEDVVRRLKGGGEEEARNELSKRKNGKSFFELFAEFYFDEGRDEFRIAGNNNEMVKNIILGFAPRRVLSVGAGSCLFARKLRQAGFSGEIDNVDINPVILRIAKERFPQIGGIKVEGASSLSAPSEYYDAVEYSFITPWTKRINPQERIPINEIERVQLHLEQNRVLKLGGIAEQTFPESAFDEATFARYTQALVDHFGFKIIEPSGISFAVDTNPPRRIGWVITAQKIGVPNLSGLDPTTLSLLSDERTRVSRPKATQSAGQTVVVVDYPIFSAREFTIRNPLTQAVSNANSSDIQGVGIESPRDLVDRIKNDVLSSPEKRTIWSSLRRDIERGTRRNYEDAEEVLAAIISRRGADRLSDWDSNMLRRLMADVNRFISRNRHNGV